MGEQRSASREYRTKQRQGVIPHEYTTEWDNRFGDRRRISEGFDE